MNEIKQPRSTQQKNRSIFKIAHQERGQAMVETAFVMIILLLLLSVIIDLGRAFFTYLALQNAAGEGAYYAAKDPVSVDNSADNPNYPDNADPNNITFRVKHESPDSPLIDWDTEDVEVIVRFWCPPTPVDIENPTQEELNSERQRTNITVPSGAFTVVRVKYQFETIGPVAGMLAVVLPDAFSDWDGTFPLRAETKQLVLEDPSNASVRCN